MSELPRSPGDLRPDLDGGLVDALRPNERVPVLPAALQFLTDIRQRIDRLRSRSRKLN
jgi:hypothetical protein